MANSQHSRITRQHAFQAFYALRASGKTPPTNEYNEGDELWCQHFLDHYSFLTPQQLQEVIKAMQHAQFWPSFNEIDNMLEELAQNEPRSSYTSLLQKQEAKGILPYKQGETLSQLTDRLGKAFYPNQSQEWHQKNASALYWLAEAKLFCQQCSKGNNCYYGGHQPKLRLTKDGRALLALGEICPKYAAQEKGGKQNEP